MTLFWLKHYIPFRCLAVLFGVTKSSAARIVQDQIESIASKLPMYCDIDNIWNESSPKLFPNCYGIVEGTECQIQVWQESAFSGKKMLYTLKYQAVIGISSCNLLDLYGPVVGSTHDVEVYHRSSISKWLETNNIKVLGDKGYIGCEEVVTPFKRKNKQIPLPEDEQQFNLKLAQFRIRVENHFSYMKKWKVLSNVYRGDLKSHSKIVACCEVLIAIEK
jgi:hypothetical protein